VGFCGQLLPSMASVIRCSLGAAARTVDLMRRMLVPASRIQSGLKLLFDLHVTVPQLGPSFTASFDHDRASWEKQLAAFSRCSPTSDNSSTANLTQRAWYDAAAGRTSHTGSVHRRFDLVGGPPNVLEGDSTPRATPFGSN